MAETENQSKPEMEDTVGKAPRARRSTLRNALDKIKSSPTKHQSHNPSPTEEIEEKSEKKKKIGFSLKKKKHGKFNLIEYAEITEIYARSNGCSIAKRK